MIAVIPFLEPLENVDIVKALQMFVLLLWNLLVIRVFAGADKKLAKQELAQAFIIISISWMLYFELTRTHEWELVPAIVWIFFMALLVIIAKAEVAFKWIYRIKHGKDIKNGDDSDKESEV